ncbi:MAG: CopD family protein [Acetobacterales bacterium]
MEYGTFDALATGLHALAAVIWVGGMFFAYVCLRPAAGALAGPERQKLWRGVFARFFPWVWMQVIVLLATGYAMLFVSMGGFGGAGLHVHIMHLTGLIMVLLFVGLFHAPWLKFKRAVDAGETETAAKHLDRIRVIVLANLWLGLFTVAVGASGRFWS